MIQGATREANISDEEPSGQSHSGGLESAPHRLAWRPMLVEVMGHLRRLGNGQRSPEACISDGNPPEGLNLSFRCSQIWSLGPRSFFTLDSWIH